MLIKSFKGILLVVCILLRTTTLFADPLKIAVGIIPGLIEYEHNLANDYMSFLTKFPEANLIFVPMPRADQLFARKLTDCVFPASTRLMPNKADLIQTEPLKTIRAYLFFKDQRFAFKLEGNGSVPVLDLTDKTIAVRRGLGMGDIRDRIKTNFVELNSDELVLKMLNIGRVDAIVAYLPDLVAAKNKADLREMPYYDEHAPVYQSEDALVCQKSDRNQQFISRANLLINPNEADIKAIH